MRKIKLSLILPCFNEAEHIIQSVSRIISQLKSMPMNYELIFVEDKSTDDTPKLLKEIKKKYNQTPIQIIWQSKNQGRGFALSTGIKHAKGKIVGYIDIDLEIAPSYIPACAKKIEQGFDVVCGWRTYDFALDSLARWLASNCYRLLTRFVLHHSLHDTESGYKFFSRSAILPLLPKIHDRHWFWDTEVMLLSQRAGLKIYELKMKFIRRKDKTSTVKLLPDTWEYLKQLWKFRSRLTKVSL